jgi:hypothetical protein
MHRSLRIALALWTVVAVTGCSKDHPTSPARTAPSNEALSPSNRTGLATVQQALESPAWKSLDALSLAGSGAAPLAGSVRSMLRDAASPGGITATATATRSALVSEVTREWGQRLASPAGTVIPPEVRGTTYVFDVELHRYVPDPSRTGAPGNGVRYVLYAVNPLSGEPVVSEEIGYADLSDEGDAAPNTAALRLEAVSGGVTFVNYRVGLVVESDAGSVDVDGTFFDGHKHLNFDIEVEGGVEAGIGELNVHFHLAVPEDDFALANETQAVAKGDLVTLDQVIVIGDWAFAIDSVHRPDRTEATVAVNGVPFARITGDASTLTVLGADGKPLPAEHRVALGRIFGLYDCVWALLGHLLAPVGGLFALVPSA